VREPGKEAMADSGEVTDGPPRPGYEPFEVDRKKTWRNRLDGRVGRMLPDSAYRPMLAGYYGLRWFARRNPGRGRLLPDFVIIGAAKAGTTSLYAWLCGHPCVSRPRAKEIHYFSFLYYRGEDWYRQFFPTERARREFAAEHGRPFLTGEASPSYMNDALAPERMHRLLPDVKLLVLLREPVDRAYSQFQMRRRQGQEPFESFEDALGQEDPARFGSQGRTVDDITRTYLARGRYAEHLERWFAVYPREQFHIRALEEIAPDPAAALAEAHDFLGLPPHRHDQLDAIFRTGYEPLPDAVRANVAEYFRPHNERLYELLGRDFGW
jgi:hypothetical protein